MNGPDRVRVFISSPVDVRPERLIAQRVIERLDREFNARFRVEAVLWEREPLIATEHFQTMITSPRDTEIVVVILWSRLGVPLPGDKPGAITGRAVTGTEWEFEDAVAGYRQNRNPDVLLYRKKAEMSLSLADRSEIQQRIDQIDRINDFMRRWFEDQSTGGSSAASWSFQTATEFEEQLETHLRGLLSRRVNGEMSVSEIRWHEGSPFQSLEPFELKHAAVFFGRNRARNEVRELLAARAAGNCGFVLVLGASGSGKSSMVRAGLLPDLLLPGMIGDVALCRYAILRPADLLPNLNEGLATAILSKSALPELRELQYDLGNLSALLASASEQSTLPIRQGLAKAGVAARLAESAQARLLLVVDQLEEIFTHENISAPQREAFIAILGALARSGVVWIVATMRSDFFDRLDRSPALSELSKGARYLLAPPDSAEIGQIVRQPARAAGLRFEVDANGMGLDDVICKSAGANAGSLPLLEFTLDQLWQNRTPAGVLTFAAYDELGGLEGALGQRAEQEFAAAPPDVRAALPSVLRSLVTVGQGAGGLPTSRPTPLARFETGSPRRRLVDAFLSSQARLLVADSEGAEPRVRVAHEALLTHWPRARDQIATDKNDLQLRARLEQMEAVWRNTPEKERNSRLLSGGLPLSEAEDLQERRKEDLEPAVVDYIQKSGIAVRKLERRRRIIYRSLSGVFLVLALAVGISAMTAFKSARVANQRATELQTALGAMFGSTAQNLLDPVSDEAAPVVAALALNGWRLGRSPEAWNAAMRLPISGSQPLGDGPWASIYSIMFSADGKSIFIGSQNNFSVFNATTGHVRTEFPLSDAAVIGPAAFGPDGRWLAAAENNTVLRIFNVTGGVVARIPHEDHVSQLAVSPDGKLLASGSGKLFRFFESNTFKEVARFENRMLTSTLQFSPDSAHVVTGSLDGTARLIETGNFSLEKQFAHAGGVTCAAFSNDGKLLAVGGADGVISLWETASRTVVRRFKHEGPVMHVAFDPAASMLASATRDAEIRLFSVDDEDPLWTSRNGGQVAGLRFSPDGRALVVTDPNGVRFKDLQTGSDFALIEHEGPVQALAFSPDGTKLASGNVGWPPTFRSTAKVTSLVPDDSSIRDTNGATRLVFAADGKTAVVIQEYALESRIVSTETWRSIGIPHEDSVLDAAVSPDGRLLATMRWGGAARLTEIPSGKEVAKLTGDGDTRAFAFSPDGSLAVTAQPDGSVQAFDSATNQRSWRIQVSSDIKDVIFSPDARLLAVLFESGDVRLVLAQSGAQVAHATLMGEKFEFAPDSSRIIDVGGNVRIIDTAHGRLVKQIESQGWILATATSPDSRLIAIGGRDQVARVFEMSSGREIARVSHAGFVTGLSFSRDGQRLASVGHDRTARILDLKSGRVIAMIPLTSASNLVAFSHTGEQLITSDGGGLRLRSLNLDQEIEKLCLSPGRNVSLLEWQRYAGDIGWRATCDCWSTPPDVVKAGLWPPKDRKLDCPSPNE